MAMRYHLVAKIEAGQHIGLCGESYSSDMFFTKHVTDRHVCRKCAVRYNENLLKLNPVPYHLGERLDLSKDDRRYDYKSIYPILSNDDEPETLGYVIIKNGWGKSWQVAPLDITINDDGAYVIRMGKPEGSYNSKEAALLALPKLVEDGTIKTEAALRVVAQEIQAKYKAWNDRAVRVEAEHAAKLARIKQAMDELLTGEITNFQRDGLLNAMALLKI